jgi:hypothetical protein
MKPLPPLWLLLGCLFAVLLASPHLLRTVPLLTADGAQKTVREGQIDLVHFWAISKVAGEQGPASVYVGDALREGGISAEVFFYPPTTLLLLNTLASPDFAQFVLRWFMLCLLVYFAAVHLAVPQLATRACPRWLLFLVALCFGGLGESLFYGQFSAVFAALWLLLFVAIMRMPQLGAVPLVLLTLKPHLGFVLPVLLLWQRRWGQLIATSVLLLCLILLTLGLWGPAPWQGYFAIFDEIVSRTAASQLLYNSSAPSSIYYGLSRLGLSALPALIIQLTAGLIALAWLWRLRAHLTHAAQLALLPIVILLFVPHWYPYDLVLLILPLLALLPVLLMPTTHWADRALWLLCFALPPLTDALNAATGLGPWPILLAALLWRGGRLLDQGRRVK